MQEVSNLNEAVNNISSEKKKVQVQKSKLKNKCDVKSRETTIFKVAKRKLEAEFRTLQKKVDIENLEKLEIELQLNGNFTEDVRLCVMELLSHEMAVEKISPTIKVVAEHIFKTKLKGLPSHTTMVNISDEAQYLNKCYTAEMMETPLHFGWNKDGTSKNKKKILETSVTLCTDQVLPTGYHSAARETSETITSGVKAELAELSVETKI